MSSVLSIDGGGVRGIIPAVLIRGLEKYIQEVEDDPHARITSYFEVMAGTSTGALIVLGLSAANRENSAPLRTTDEVVQFYKDKSKLIFTPTPHHKLIEEEGAKYTSKNLEEILASELGDRKLGQTLTNVVIPAVNTHTLKLTVFKTSKAKRDKNAEFYLRDIARGTTAAPTYFKRAKVTSCNGVPYTLIDGGIEANDPMELGIEEANELKPNTEESNLVLSLGCGKNLRNVKGSKWAPICKIFDIKLEDAATQRNHAILDLALEAHNTRHVKNSNELPPKNRTLRIQEELPFKADFDDVSKIDQLEKFGNEVLQKHAEALKEFARLLVKRKRTRTRTQSLIKPLNR